MLEIKYTATPETTAKVTLDFLSNRPFVSAMFKFMQISCMFLCLGFAINVYNHAVQPKDYMALSTAVIWLLFYKKINRWLIKNNLKHRKFNQLDYVYKIDEQSIFCTVNNKVPHHITWKKLKYILQTKDGYILPMTGFTNAGKFLWLPFQSLENNNAEETFLNLVKKFKLKVKNIAK